MRPFLAKVCVVVYGMGMSGGFLVVVLSWEFNSAWATKIGAGMLLIGIVALFCLPFFLPPDDGGNDDSGDWSLYPRW